MTTDLDIIKQLEKITGKTLMEMPVEELRYYKNNGYALDSNGAVVGLNLSNCKLTDVSPIQGLTALKTLSLSGNQLTDVSPIQGLTALKTLSLSGNQLTDVSPIQGLTALKKLYLYDNQLTDVSPIQGLTALTDLRLYNNRLTDVSPIQGLTALKILSLSGNQLTDVSPLQKLTALTTLGLGGNQLTDVSPIQGLTALTYLYLGHNQLTDVSPIKGLTALTELYLYDNQLTDVSLIQGLTALKTLNLSGNQLTDVSPIQGLTALTDLDLSSNQLTDISPLQSLTALTDLDLGVNQLTDVSPIKGLTALKELSLYENQLTDVSPLLNLKQLQKLLLMDNNITRLPQEIRQIGLEIKLKYDYSAGLFVEGNPLETPPIEIVEQGHKAVLNYFKELETASVRLLQCKLLIVGNGDVGKTTLMKKCLHPELPIEPGKEETTHGINIEPWQLAVPFTDSNGTPSPETVKLHFWDFGGQDIYHATHQFFLTKRSLYLFVWEGRREEETRSFDYWLNVIKLLSEDSPVIIIMNKADLRKKEIDEAIFKTKFPNIQCYRQISCLTGQGLGELTEEIRRNLAVMPHLCDRLPLVWLQIRDRLDQVKQDKNYISQQEYFALCKKYGLDQERAEYVGSYLHDLGAILHYSQDPLLKHTVILKPEWATEALYKLIDTPEIQDNSGSFRFHQLTGYWDTEKYPPDKHLELLRLMEKFELCFNFTGTDQYFVPEILPTLKTPSDLSIYKGSGVLHFHYHYEFMPKGIVSRFMARLFYMIHEQQFWKNCVVLGFDKAMALVTGEPLNRRVTIAIRGKNQQELLAIIRSHFNHIHASLNMKDMEHYNEMIPCICSECKNAADPYFYKYNKLKLAEEKNMEVMNCNESLEQVPLKQLLSGIEGQEPGLKRGIITAVMQLQGIAATILPDEDSRNTNMAQTLSNMGYIVKDQSRWGLSGTGKKPGELDIKIETPDGRTAGIIEAFILKGLHRNVIDPHLQKIFEYDPNGLKELFILVYVDSTHFLDLWGQYLGHVPEIPFKHQLLKKEALQEQETGFAEIKMAQAFHMREGKEVTVSHIFVNMSGKRSS